MKKFLLASAALGLAAALNAPAAFADILMGVAGPVSGQVAVIGEQMKRGVEMAVKDINAGGGINGEKLVAEIGDDGCDPKQAVAVANQLAGKAVKGVIGHYCSSSSIPASKVYEEEGIMMISPASTNPVLTDEGGWNVMRACGRDDAQGTVAGKYIAATYKGKNVAIIDDKSAYGKGLADETRKAMNADGLKEVLNESITAGEKDFSALVSKMKAANIDVVYFGAYHTDIGLILRQMRDQGLMAQGISGDANNTEELAQIAGKASDGFIFTFAPDARNLPSAAPAVKSFKDAGFEPEGFTLVTYASVQAYAAAIKATGSTEGKKLAEWLRAGNPVETIIGTLTFNEKGDLKDPKYVFYKFQDGKFAEDPGIK